MEQEGNSSTVIFYLIIIYKYFVIISKWVYSVPLNIV